MKSGFYLTTAWNNIKKNYRFYIPQIFTGIGLLSCFYIVYTLAKDDRLREVRGGSYIPLFMGIGVAVIALLSTILILYTNSFLMRQRRREYGLYNVLGMEKRHIGRIMLFETAISSTISVVLGLMFGMLFYKLCSLLICFLFQSDIVIGFYFITPKTLIPAALLFIALYTLAYVINRICIARMKPVELLSSKATGEKEPKIKWPIFVLGLLTLGTGYALSVTMESPLEALIFFFIAVFLVIIGTYCLFTAGSIFVLKCLKKNKKYYYTKKHMTSVSGLLYRMKQNAVGLASICILSTGVLVMISTTVSLYSNMQDTLDRNYPQEMYLSASYCTEDGYVDVPSQDLIEMSRNAAQKNGQKIQAVEAQEYLSVAYCLIDNTFSADIDKIEHDMSLMASVNFITEEAYTALTGESLCLAPGEIAVCNVSSTLGQTKVLRGTVSIVGREFTVKQYLAQFPVSNRMVSFVSCYGIVVSDKAALEDVYHDQLAAYREQASEYSSRVAVKFADRNAVKSVGDEIDNEIGAQLSQWVDAQPDYTGGYQYRIDSLWSDEEDMVGMYGALLFLGIILGLVCLFTTVLIIYYKQISEGYEDRDRYQIMKKVGMSDGEVKKSIRSQTLLVFFLPLVTAGIHVAFAFPILNRLLHVLMLSSTTLFIICMLITYAVFALVYVLIFSMTAKVYYKIVR